METSQEMGGRETLGCEVKETVWRKWGVRQEKDPRKRRKGKVTTTKCQRGEASGASLPDGRSLCQEIRGCKVVDGP